MRCLLPAQSNVLPFLALSCSIAALASVATCWASTDARLNTVVESISTLERRLSNLDLRIQSPDEGSLSGETMAGEHSPAPEASSSWAEPDAWAKAEAGAWSGSGNADSLPWPQFPHAAVPSPALRADRLAPVSEFDREGEATGAGSHLVALVLAVLGLGFGVLAVKRWRAQRAVPPVRGAR